MCVLDHGLLETTFNHLDLLGIFRFDSRHSCGGEPDFNGISDGLRAVCAQRSARCRQKNRRYLKALATRAWWPGRPRVGRLIEGGGFSRGFPLSPDQKLGLPSLANVDLLTSQASLFASRASRQIESSSTDIWYKSRANEAETSQLTTTTLAMKQGRHFA